MVLVVWSLNELQLSKNVSLFCTIECLWHSACCREHPASCGSASRGDKDAVNSYVSSMSESYCGESRQFGLRWALTCICFLNSQHVCLELCSSLYNHGQISIVMFAKRKWTKTEEGEGMIQLPGTLLRKLSTGTGHKDMSLESTRGGGLTCPWNFAGKSGHMQIFRYWYSG